MRERALLAPHEKFYLPFRWQFVPVETPGDRSIAWRWRAYNQAGEVVMESGEAFETLTDCMDDARTHGYARS